MKPAWKQHGNSIIKPASVRVQDRTTLELASKNCLSNISRIKRHLKNALE
jgi:hypothetical protein